MAHTQPRTPEDPGGVSLYLLRWFRSAAVVVLVPLSTAVIAHGQTLAFRDARELLVDEPATFVELLEAARPAPVSTETMGAILRALPPEGEVTELGAAAQQKVDAARQLLTATRRDWYEIKVIDLPQAGLALHARAVVLIPAPTIALLSAAELQALVAHEIGHEYVWTEWQRARQHADQDRLKELELVCDAIAAVTLRQLGMDPSKVIDAIEKVARFNRQRFGAATNEKNYPTVAERRAFARQLQQWLRDSSWPSRSGQARGVNRSEENMLGSVRPEGSPVGALIARGLERSETFRDLVAKLDNTDVVVYVRFSSCNGRVPACLLWASPGPTRRHLLIKIDRFGRSENELTALVAHELQHASEVASAPGITDIASFQEWFAAHGRRGWHGFETDRAGEVTRKVMAELAGPCSRRC